MSSAQRVAGAKRKRTILGDGEDVATKLKNKLHHGVTEVRRAAKKLKGQEIQKSVKRLKGVRARNPSSPESQQLEAELVYLKGLDTELFGVTALQSKLNKDKVLSSNDDFTSALSLELSSDLIVMAKPGSPKAKVDARLLSSKALASEVSAVVMSLRNIISPPKHQETDLDNEGDALGPALGKEGVQLPTALENVSDSGSDASEELDDSMFPAQRGEKEDELADDSGWESGSISGPDDMPEENSDGERENGDNPLKKVKLVAKPSAKTVATSKSGTGTGSSTFLPSLSVGFTRGESDSEPEDIDEAPKKNRRGQRARRAIWEKKYGRNANHVKKTEDDASASRQRSGAVWTNKRQRESKEFARPPPHPSAHVYQMHANWLQRNSVAESRQNKPLHPSWEAKKKLKEKQNPSILPAQGKRIVF